MLVTPLSQIIQTEKWDTNNDLKSCVALDRWQIENADVVCVPSKGVLKSYESLMDIHSDDFSRLEITPLGITPEYSSAASHPSGPRRLLFVGRLEWRKGIHTLLEALPDLMQRFPDWECHIVGNDQIPAINNETFKQGFQKRYNNALWLNRVIFHGMVPQDELLAHYQSCDLFVAPSLFESFGLIFQEAMQYGKPVVGCLTGGIPEVVEHGVEGLLVPPDQPEALGAALARLMQDDELRLRMGNAARARIHERDNYQTMAARLEEVYRRVIVKKGAQYKARRKAIWG
ncbi:MAG: glycosyltransferase family 4 protein [Anaerolineales bacterium]|uniref:glycosyltransferase family 4 protein n=1 Tax=Candidatus Villigracilis proximus TaxID=3140683 RepID=UPI003136446E|nr:glycosyltransferase family 4 protein [Anaerolineales bacterium]